MKSMDDDELLNSKMNNLAKETEEILIHYPAKPLKVG